MIDQKPQDDPANAPESASASKDSNAEPAIYPYDDEEQLICAREDELLRMYMKALPGPEVFSPKSREAQQERLGKLKAELSALEAKRFGEHTWGDCREISQLRAKWKVLLWRDFPINILPPEIRVHIFTLAILSHSSREVTKSRIAVAGVCRDWRNLILDSPSMWSIIEFKGKPPYPQSELALKRSKNAPLILLVDVRNPKWSRSESESWISKADMSALMSHIAPAIRRVTELYILCDTWEVVLAALATLRDASAPVLRRFEVMRSGKAYVKFDRNAVPQELKYHIDIFQGGAPRLDHVNLEGVHVNWENAPFEDLRNLEMRKMAVEVMPKLTVFRQMLFDSNSLRALVLEGAGPQWVEEGADIWTPVNLPCLENLTLGDFAVDYGVFILRLFTAPRLRRLTMCLMEEDCTSLFTKLTGMFPILTVLFLFDINVQNDDTMVNFFLSLPKLMYLKVMRMGDDMFDLMLRRVPQKIESGDVEMTPLCSKIETVECGIKIPPLNVWRMITGRAELGVPLRRMLLPLNIFHNLEKKDSSLLRNTGILSLIPPGSRPELDNRYVDD